MTLSTQLARGTLALPMLVLFAALALVANRTAEAEPYADARAELAQAQAATICAALPRPPLVLSQAPADLGPIAHRHSRTLAVRMAARPGCRA